MYRTIKKKSRPNIEKKRTEKARKTIRKAEKKINAKANEIVDHDAIMAEKKEELDNHQRSFFWFKGHTASDVPMYYLAFILVAAIPIADYVFVGKEAAASLWVALFTPAFLMFVLTVLIILTERHEIELTDGKFLSQDEDDEDELDEDEKKKLNETLKKDSRLKVLHVLKAITILSFGIWTAFVMTNVEVDLIHLANETARAEALISGGEADVEEIPPRWEIVLNKPMILFWSSLVMVCHAIAWMLSWFIFQGVQYVLFFRRKNSRLTRLLREGARGRRVFLAELSSLYEEYEDEVEISKPILGPMGIPEPKISDFAEAYLEEFLASSAEHTAKETTSENGQAAEVFENSELN